MTFIKYFFIFFIFSVFGWILELFYRSLTRKKVVNPGFMIGCFVPLYGFGAIIMCMVFKLLEVLTPAVKLSSMFILSAILLTILEYITGIILLKFFNLKLWDYSEYKFNYKGIICLRFSIIWGSLALVFYFYLYDFVNNLSIRVINNQYGLFIFGIAVGIFLIDLIVSLGLLNRIIKYAADFKDAVDIEILKIE